MAAISPSLMVDNPFLSHLFSLSLHLALFPQGLCQLSLTLSLLSSSLPPVPLSPRDLHLASLSSFSHRLVLSTRCLRRARMDPRESWKTSVSSSLQRLPALSSLQGEYLALQCSLKTTRPLCSRLVRPLPSTVAAGELQQQQW